MLEYERAIARHYRMNHAIATSSGSAAVMAALRGIDAQPGEEFIVPATAPICTVLPLLELNLIPVFCDVRADSFGLSPEDLESLINRRTCAVIEVPMWGYPIPLADTREMTKHHGVPLILDLAHAHQTRLAGALLPAYGDISCFSTHEGKFISTGEGGFVLTHDAAYEKRARGFTRFGDLKGREVGLNLKLCGLQAGLGLSRIRRLDEVTAMRHKHRKAILSGLANPLLRELPIAQTGIPSGYALLLQSMEHGRDLVRHQTAAGIPSDIAKYDNRPLYEYPLLQRFERPCPNGAALLRSLTTIPLHPELVDDDIDYIVDVLNAFEAPRICRGIA